MNAVLQRWKLVNTEGGSVVAFSIPDCRCPQQKHNGN